MDDAQGEGGLGGELKIGLASKVYRWRGAPCGEKNSIIRDGLVEKSLLTHFQFLTLFALIFDTEIYICNQTSAKLARKSNIFQCFINLQHFPCKVNMYTVQGVHIL